MDLFQLEVFADAAYLGNPLAVFPDAGGLSSDQMQAIAREMNLSETVFVASTEGSEYAVRIFTPSSELPFAGHPAIGCAWLLLELGKVTGDTVTQHSAAGATELSRVGEDLWFERSGQTSAPDSEREVAATARTLGLTPEDLVLDWDGTELRPAISDAGLAQLMVPVRDLATLQAIAVPTAVDDERHMGPYCFTRRDEGIHARGFFPGVGVIEDPATGSAAAGLGIYLDNHVGPVEAVITQGAEMGRRSTIRMKAASGTVSIGGSTRLVMKGSLEALP